MQEHVEEFKNIVNRLHKLDMDWYRHLLTLATGSLVIMSTFISDTPDQGMARYFPAATWVFLGIGILAGVGATYAPISRTANLAENFLQALQNGEFQDTPSKTISAYPSVCFLLCKHLMLISLLLAVICLTVYAVITTLTP